jgi:hypothetical protein
MNLDTCGYRIGFVYWILVFFGTLHRSHQGIWGFCGQQLPAARETVETLLEQDKCRKI